MEPNADGTHAIHVIGCSVFVYDTFNFGGDNDNYGYWNREEQKFSGIMFGNENNHLSNTDFEEFRSLYGFGSDFIVFTKLHPVANFIKLKYLYHP